jgi:hypothetical protein
MSTFTAIQGVPGGKVNILGSHSIGHSKQEKCVCICVVLRTVSEIELFHCTVVATRHALTRVAKYIDVDCGIFKKVLY